MDTDPDFLNRLFDRVRHARQAAKAAHEAKGQLYDGQPYVIHLDQVVQCLINHEFAEQEDLLVAGYFHDALEDTDMTPEWLRMNFGENVTSIVMAGTDAPGANRKERKAKTLPKIRKFGVPAIAIKLADRIANIAHSKQTGSSLLKMYLKEHPEFVSQLYDVSQKQLREIWETYFTLVAPQKTSTGS